MFARILFAVTALASVAQGQKLFWAEQIPKVARAGAPVRVRLRADGVARVVYEPDGGGATRELTNVGTGLFELELTAPPVEARLLFQRYTGLLRGFTAAGASAVAANLVLRYADGLPPVRITPVAADAQRSDYVFNLHAPAFFSGLITPTGFIALDREPFVRRMYALMPDDFDFVNVVNGSLGVFENRFHGAIRNAVTGTGQPAFDAGASWGSARRLIGFTMFPNAAIFDGAEDGYSHEQGHQWINYSRAPFDDRRGSHWPISSMAAGIMGWSDPTNGQGLSFPCRFVPQADGSVQVMGNRLPAAFTDFDLYLMGLIGASEVAPQYLVTNPAKAAAAATNSCSGLGTLQPSDFRQVTVDELIAANGPRVPSAAAAPKNFRGIHLVLSRDGLLTPEEMAYFDVLARRSEERGTVPVNVGRAAVFGNPWFAATRGKSTMAAKLSTQPLPTLTYGGVVNAGSFRVSDLGPGAVATIFGSDLAATTASASSVPLPLTLGGLRVMVNGRPAPLFYVSPTQINFQLPADLSVTPFQPNDPSALAAVHVERDGVGSNLAFIEIRAAAPGIITYGENVAVATLPDGSVMGPANPAAPGQTITLYWVGSAPLSETIPAGTPAPDDRLVRVTGPASVTVGGGSQTVTFLGATPGGVGLFQANVQLSNTLSGEYSLVLTVGGRLSNGARLFVRRP